MKDNEKANSLKETREEVSEAKTSNESSKMVPTLEKKQYEDSKNIADKTLTKIEPKKFDITMSQDDLMSFKLAVQEGSTLAFIGQYISKHKDNNVSMEEDVYNLALTRSIARNDVLFTEYLLSHIKYSDSLLVNIDGVDNNPIYAALIVGNNDILSQISEYLHNYQHDVKFSMPEGAFMDKMSRVVASPRSESYTPKTYIEKFLRPVYTTESIESIIDRVGQDTIDYYYH